MVPTLLALALGLGWGLRERAYARERAAMLASQTINLDQLKMDVFKDQGNPVGQIGLYVQGETPGCSVARDRAVHHRPGQVAACASRSR